VPAVDHQQHAALPDSLNLTQARRTEAADSGAASVKELNS